MSITDYLIITNNPLVSDKYKDDFEVFFVNGSVEDTLIKVRDLVHQGYILINHPLPASLRMLFAPCRSIAVERPGGKINPAHVDIIEGSIEKYKRHMAVRRVDEVNAEDYKLIDLKLFESGMNFKMGIG